MVEECHFQVLATLSCFPECLFDCSDSSLCLPGVPRVAGRCDVSDGVRRTATQRERSARPGTRIHLPGALARHEQGTTATGEVVDTVPHNDWVCCSCGTVVKMLGAATADVAGGMRVPLLGLGSARLERFMGLAVRGDTLRALPAATVACPRRKPWRVYEPIGDHSVACFTKSTLISLLGDHLCQHLKCLICCLLHGMKNMGCMRCILVPFEVKVELLQDR